MVPSVFSLLAIPAALLPLVAAKTDLDGCTRTDISSPAGASYAWIVPETGELCDPLDCGGGRAPPKTTVPGCAAYSGTATYSPSYLPGFTAATQTAAASTTMAAASASATASASDDSDDTVDGDDVDDEDAGDDDGDDDDDYPSVWRSADNPSATFNPYTLSAWPSTISTFWIPVDLGQSSSTWEPVVQTVDSDGVTNFLPAETPASSDLPAICAFATTSGCGINTSTISVSRPAATSTADASAAATGASSVTGSWVKTIPTFLRDANGDIVRAARSTSASRSGSASSSASASAQPSQGVAAGLGYSAGGVGAVLAVLGALAAL